MVRGAVPLGCANDATEMLAAQERAWGARAELEPGGRLLKKFTAKLLRNKT